MSATRAICANIQINDRLDRLLFHKKPAKISYQANFPYKEGIFLIDQKSFCQELKICIFIR
jgi:hypothetical protein